MKRIKGNFKVIYIFIAVGLVGILIEVVGKSNLISGDWSTISTNFISLFPYIIGIALAIWWFKRRG